MIALEISLFMKGLWFGFKYRFLWGHVYQKHLCKFLRMRLVLSKTLFCLVSSCRKVFTKASLLKVLYFRYLITLGFILGKCIFITATIILWKSDSLISITVVVWKLSGLFVNSKSIHEGFSRFFKQVGCFTRLRNL